MRRFLLLLIPATLFAADHSGLTRGARELALSGAVYLPHDSPADSFGMIAARLGVYVALHHQLGVDATTIAYSRIQDVYLSGFYRCTLARPERRLAPYFGAAFGANVAHFDALPAQHAAIVKAQAGIRYFFTERASLDFGYDLMYRRPTMFSLTGRTSSILTFGFSKVF
jgi:hypothetical protein